MTEISVYSDNLGGGISDLFSSPEHNSPTIVLAPGHTQPPHRGCRPDLNFSKDPVPQLSGEGFSSQDIVVRSFPNAVVFSDYGVVKDAKGHFVTETFGAFGFQRPEFSHASEFEPHSMPPEVLARGN